VAYATTQYRTCPDSHSANWFDPSCQPGNKQCSNGDNILLMFMEIALTIQDAVKVDLAIIRTICAVVILQLITIVTELTMYQFMHMLLGIIPGRVVGQLAAELAQVTCYANRNPTSQAYYWAWLEDQTEEVAFIRWYSWLCKPYTSSGWVLLGSGLSKALRVLITSLSWMQTVKAV